MKKDEFFPLQTQAVGFTLSTMKAQNNNQTGAANTTAARFTDGDTTIVRDCRGNYSASKNVNDSQDITAQQTWKLIDAADAVLHPHDYNREPLACKVSSFSDAVKFARGGNVEGALEGLLFSVDEMLNGGFVNVTAEDGGQGLIDKVRDALQAAVKAINYQGLLYGNYEREELQDPYADLFFSQQVEHFAKARRFHQLMKKVEAQEKAEAAEHLAELVG